MKKTVTSFVYLLIFLFYPYFSSAQVFINEVQISPIEDRFIELYNDGGSGIDLTGWYIQRKTATGSSFNSLITKTDFEGKTIPSGGYFLISRTIAGSDITKGNLTLTESNTLRLRNSDGEDVDIVKWESLNEGESYQKTDNGWVLVTPTPGSANLGVQPPSGDTKTGVENSVQEQSSLPNTTSASSWPVEPQIFTDIKNAPKVAVAGADVLFEGAALGLKKEPLEGARYLWTFGEGGTKEGQKVLYNYSYPGKYVVVLNTSSGAYSASDRAIVDVIPADIAISSVGVGANSFVEIYNKTKYEINLSWWRLRAGGNFFTIPKDTIVLPGSKIIFPAQNTGFTISKKDSVELLYPNGIVAVSYAWESDTKVQAQVSAQTTHIMQAKISKTDTVPAKDNIEAEDVKEFDKEIIGGVQQSANIFTASGSSEDDVYKWLFGVTALAVISIFGVLLSKRENFAEGRVFADTDSSRRSYTESEEYEIIEDEK